MENGEFEVRVWIQLGARTLVKKMSLPFALSPGLRLVVGECGEDFVEVECEDVVYIPKEKAFVALVSPEVEWDMDDVEFWRSVGFVEDKVTVLLKTKFVS